MGSLIQQQYAAKQGDPNSYTLKKGEIGVVIGIKTNRIIRAINEDGSETPI